MKKWLVAEVDGVGGGARTIKICIAQLTLHKFTVKPDVDSHHPVHH
jgi:hypothetical protein